MVIKKRKFFKRKINRGKRKKTKKKIKVKKKVTGRKATQRSRSRKSRSRKSQSRKSRSKKSRSRKSRSSKSRSRKSTSSPARPSRKSGVAKKGKNGSKKSASVPPVEAAKTEKAATVPIRAAPPVSIINDGEIQLKRELVVMREEFVRLYAENNKQTGSILDFTLDSIIGRLDFATVYAARTVITRQRVAIKAIEKQYAIVANQTKNIAEEKRILQALEHHPFIVKYFFSFQDAKRCYIVMEQVTGGSVAQFLQEHHSNGLPEFHSKIYLAQLILAVEYLHYVGIVFRGLNANNVLIAASGYLKLSDFRHAKVLGQGARKTNTVCGVIEYCAPEMFEELGYGMSVDWWAFAVIVYLLNTGTLPFTKPANMDMKSFTDKLSRPEDELSFHPKFSFDLCDLIFGLFQVDVSKRYGCLPSGAKQFRQHSWFTGHINFTRLYNDAKFNTARPFVKIPYKPKVSERVSGGSTRVSRAIMEHFSEVRAGARSSNKQFRGLFEDF